MEGDEEHIVMEDTDYSNTLKTYPTQWPIAVQSRVSVDFSSSPQNRQDSQGPLHMATDLARDCCVCLFLLAEQIEVGRGENRLLYLFTCLSLWHGSLIGQENSSYQQEIALFSAGDRLIINVPERITNGE